MIIYLKERDKMENLTNRKKSNSLLNTYNRVPLSFVEGKGVWLIDKKGERYLDIASGIAVNSLGHAHPRLIKALNNQAMKLWHTSNLYNIPNQEKLAKLLVDQTFADKVFFTNSGAESIECAIKMARRYFFSIGQKTKNQIITFSGSFHGRTIGTIAAAGSKKLLEGFGPKASGFSSEKIGELETLQKRITKRTCAILIEPILGEGGIIPIDGKLLKELKTLCIKNKILLIFDEVQTGIGRTGYFLAHEKFRVKPDIVALAKGLGGGFPIGACLATEEAAKGMTPGTHGSTYGGNPLACAVATAVVNEILKPELLEGVRQKGNYFKMKLKSLVKKYPHHLEEVRGEGLMLGLKCLSKNLNLIEECRKEKLLVVAGAENTIRVLPPLNIKINEINQALDKLERALSK